MSRDGNFACRIHPAAQSAIGEQQWVTVSLWVWSVVGWLIVYQLGILSLSCSQYSQTICWRGWDYNACLGVRNSNIIEAWSNSLDRRPPWFCLVSPQLQKTKKNDNWHSYINWTLAIILRGLQTLSVKAINRPGRKTFGFKLMHLLICCITKKMNKINESMNK